MKIQHLLQRIIKNWKHNRKESEYTAGSIATKGKSILEIWKDRSKSETSGRCGAYGRPYWMLGDNHPKVRWPQCGEIDIMEHVGFNADTIFGTIHTGAYNHMKGTHKGKKNIHRKNLIRSIISMLLTGPLKRLISF